MENMTTLEKYLKDNNMTILGLSKKLGMNFSTVYYHVKGIKEMKASTALKYSKELNIPLEELIK